MTIIEKYTSLSDKHEILRSQLKKQTLLISLIRLLTAICFGLTTYFYFKTDKDTLLLLSFLAVVVFLVLVKLHGKISFKKKINNELININTDELAYINNNELKYNSGEQYIDTSHSYSYDLDIFGDKSLFQVLNRTATHIGESRLAQTLLSKRNNEAIILNQEAIQELTKEVEWRHQILAYAKTTNDNKETYQKLIDWSKKENNKISPILKLFAFLSPVIYFSVLITSFVSENPVYGDIALYLFLFNIFVLLTQLPKIKAELIDATKVNQTLKNYSLIIEQIENKTFTSKRLKALQNQLNNFNVADSSTTKNGASNRIKKLSQLFGQLENITNPVGAGVFNGAILYHLHTLRSLYQWRDQNKTEIEKWLNVIGEIEVLSSLANFAFNNPDFTYPTLNSNYKIHFNDLGHPLINSNIRVNNNIDFSDQNFIILTGSNMSGKSTFLRSLGINMVLATTGSPICASSSNIHPLNVCVSMRLSDSLNDNESYFFAEVKRLKEIMNKADQEISFILLDEILRGTNSYDKRTGTVEVIKKIIAKNVIGAIATHDLKVCATTEDYPDQLVNKCFEVEIVDNDLYFDYQLRDGVCKNKSATFLMKKMEVI